MARKQHPVEELIGGVAIAGVFTFLHFAAGWGWWVIFPIVFGGVMPAARAVGRMLSGPQRQLPKQREDKDPKSLAARREKEVLRVAQRNHGVVTPSLIAVETSLSIDEAEKMLQGFAGKGVCTMEVRDSGRIEYEFADFRSDRRLT